MKYKVERLYITKFAITPTVKKKITRVMLYSKPRWIPKPTNYNDLNEAVDNPMNWIFINYH